MNNTRSKKFKPIDSSQLTKEDKIILQACAKSFLFFVTKILRVVPTKQQLEVIKAIDDGYKKIAIKSGHGVGKTTTISWFVIWFGLFKYDAKIPMTAPTSAQLFDILLPEISKWIDKLPELLKSRIVISKEKVEFDNGNFAIVRTARPEKPEALQGFHATNILFVLEEASGIPRQVFEVAEGALTSDNSYAIMAGNPTRTSGYFYEVFHDNTGIWKLFTFNAELSENVSREAIENFRKKYGRDSDVYRVRVLGEFPTGSTNAVFSATLIEEAIYREVYDDRGAEIWAVDVADYNGDRSVLAKRKGNHLYDFIAVMNYDLPDLVGLIVREYKQAKVKPKYIFIDTIGVGASLPSMCHKVGLENVIGVKASQRAVENEKYKNARAEWFFRMRDALANGRLIENDDLIGELGAITYEYSSDDKLQITAKKKIKDALGRSPDIADAFAMTFADYGTIDDEDEQQIEEYEIEDSIPIYSFGGGVW